MTTPLRRLTTPRDADLGLARITNRSGLSISALPNGRIFAIEHRRAESTILVNQILGSPLAGGIGRMLLRLGPSLVEAMGAEADTRFGAGEDRFVWEGAAGDARHRLVLWLHPARDLWLWRLTVENRGAEPLRAEAILVQDLGLGSRGFVMGNEAFASQYIDHHVADHPAHGPVVMSRQNLAQGGGNPWVAHGCLGGAQGYATDAGQLLGPGYRDSGRLDPGARLPSEKLQHEVACAMIQSAPREIAPGEAADWTFFALFTPDHPEASGAADLARLDQLETALADFAGAEVATASAPRPLIARAAPLAGDPPGAEEIAARYPERCFEETDGGRLLSFFVADGALNRHVALREKDALLARRHGAILRTGQGMLLDETTLCATVFMHGVFGALLSLGNTSFHRLFSSSRDPYGITRSGGLRILMETAEGWRLLAEPSLFDMGLSDCRWIYRFGAETVSVRAIASGADPAMIWRIAVEGAPRRFLVSGALVLGEREYEQAALIEIDAGAARAAFRPDPDSLWGRAYPRAVYHLVTPAPGAVEEIGGAELLGAAPEGLAVALRTAPVTAFDFAVTGALDDPAAAERLAAKYAAAPEAEAGLAAAADYWRHVTRETRIEGGGAEVAALGAALPWFAQNAMIHLTVPHGLEQSGGAAWGTRDVCQGPLELLLAFEHDAEARAILEILFSEQGAESGDWPQWFMAPPYSHIRDAHSHGDILVWPLKALCDYIETTGDLGFLDAALPWHGAERRDPVTAHVAKIIATARSRFIPGTHLMRYGEGDWNDSLQPADPRLREWLVSSWTVALLIHELDRYAAILTRAGRAAEEIAALSAAMRADFRAHLIRGGTVAGYALFDAAGGAPELMLHPEDRRTGLHYSLLPITQGILSGLFTEEETRHHLGLVRDHLSAPDGIRLMERPVAYHGGPERIFRRAESAAFLGREIGLMYVHAHLRQGEAMAALGDAEALWTALRLANPVTVAAEVANASLRQRNAYFSSEDASFPDRYRADAEWDRVREGTVAIDGGWRIYSSGPGIFTQLLIRRALGLTRWYGERRAQPLLPARLGPVTVRQAFDGRAERRELG